MLNNAVVILPVALSQHGRAKISGTFFPGESLTVYCQLFVVDPGAAAGFASSLGSQLTVSP